MKRTIPFILATVALCVLFALACEKDKPAAPEGGEAAAAKKAVEPAKPAAEKAKEPAKEPPKATAKATPAEPVKAKPAAAATPPETPKPAAAAPAEPKAAAAGGGNPIVVIETSMGTIEAELYQEKAPLSTANFLQYTDDKFFDGTIFHRVIDGFMIQGGGFTPSYEKKGTREPIKNEAQNGLKNVQYTLAMARTAIVDSATAQFFINVKDNPFLDHRSADPRGFGYAVFGKVIAGEAVVDEIKGVTTGPGGPFPKDAPQTQVVIKSIRRK